MSSFTFQNWFSEYVFAFFGMLCYTFFNRKEGNERFRSKKNR